ncbi:hypothetical protein OIDMADRAFT_21449 [Oidiodendron maius Zn]|uniref:Uncharacterized protein n=1 Tax=Oidiodendron maius (strain Zn) TaxID=913774 RepID=A0A0C3GVA7_OIDMZ|nr:hypothetical protein OIDMADRAFT_21449 [Oidiodendron maius Zn]
MLQTNQPGWKNWLSTVNLLSEKANLTVLNLEIRLAEKFYVSIWDMPLETDSGYKKRMLHTYQGLIQPVTALRGLKNFFVHLNWGSSCGVLGQGPSDGRGEIEQELERMVMGQEYNAWKCGKEVRTDLSMCEY